MSGAPVLDLFAGLGGWDVAARELGLDPLGIEWCEAACATRDAVGLRTLRADVATVDPVTLGAVWGLIGSPPCPTFSAAGGRAGRRVIEIIVRCLHELAAGADTRVAAREEAYAVLLPAAWEAELARARKSHRSPDRARAELRARRDAEMSLLVVEPLRFVLAMEPRWVALEQVPEVLGVWTVLAGILGGRGYHCWAGVLSAERFGVAQTRRRAFLLASLDHEVREPPATHQRYIAPRRRDETTLGLFDAPEPERIVASEDRHLLPWVSMAEALGWAMTDRPAMTITGGGTVSGGVEVFGNAARKRMAREERAGRWALRASAQANACERHADEPAPTITGGHDHNERCWVPTHLDCRQAHDGIPVGLRSVDEPARTLGAQGLAKGRDIWVRGSQRGHHALGGDRERRAERSVDQPSLTVDTRADLLSWTAERPATTVNGDPRISEPGHHDPEVSGSQQANAVRVTLAEALVLQGFPPDYPVQGAKAKRFEQVGNAVPPLLAWHVLRAVLPAVGVLKEAA